VIHRSVLLYQRARYLRWSLVLLAASIALYVTERPFKSGSTWQGYALGTIGAALILWLTLLGLRKRAYSSALGTVQGWTSAHVYLGTTLLVVATLHAVRFGSNIHTFAYGVMCLVIASGFVGLSGYLRVPTLAAENRAGATRPDLFAELYALDQQTREVARKCSVPVQLAAVSAVERTAVGGGVLAQLSGRDDSFFIPGEEGKSTPQPNRDQQAVVDFVAGRVPRAEKVIEAGSLQTLLTLLCRRQVILRRIRVDIRLKGWMKLWLYIHVPLTAALLIALAAHVASTFVYR
jgi:hypothetical protein